MCLSEILVISGILLQTLWSALQGGIRKFQDWSQRKSYRLTLLKFGHHHRWNSQTETLPHLKSTAEVIFLKAVQYYFAVLFEFNLQCLLHLQFHFGEQDEVTENRSDEFGGYGILLAMSWNSRYRSRCSHFWLSVQSPGKQTSQQCSACSAFCEGHLVDCISDSSYVRELMDCSEMIVMSELSFFHVVCHFVSYWSP